MNTRAEALHATVWAATLCSFAMIANQIAGKAVRDALFLSQFSVDLLPRMVVVSAVLSLVFVLLASRILRKYGPALVVPGSFGVSCLVLLLIWIASGSFPGAAAVALYLHVAVLGAILVSWFWLLLSECFDARAARSHVARIAAGGTLGGLVGGLTAERIGALYSPDAMLPILAALHVVCALMARRVVATAAEKTTTSSRDETSPAKDQAPAANDMFGFAALLQSRYMRDIALMVLLGTLAAALLDFAFKVQVTQAYISARSLLRFFAGFYTLVALLTFVVQTFLVSRLLRAPQDLSRNVAMLPLVVILGSLVCVLMPGLAVLTAARGLESVIRNSIFRSSYEVFFNPIAAVQKRAAKTMIDVGFDRLGDLFGGLLIQGMIFLVGVSAGVPFLLILAALFAAVAAWRIRQLHGGYVVALEGAIRQKISPTASAHERELATRHFFLSEITELHPTLHSLSGIVMPNPNTKAAAATQRQPEIRRGQLPGRIGALQSKDVASVVRALEDSEPLTAEMIVVTIPLLAWDPVCAAASLALRRVVEVQHDLLTAAVVDPTTDFAVRRRIPPILAYGKSPRIVEALLRTLADRRFEVRYRAALALARIHHRHPDVPIEREAVLEVIATESQVDQRMWNTRRLLDDADDTEQTPFYREVLYNRTHKSLEHLFHLLSLAFARQPLRVAYEGLHTDDPVLRSTALEYLESILPAAIRHSLWPLLGRSRDVAPTTKSEEELLESLLLSHESIVLQLEKLKPRKGPGGSS